MRTVRVLIVAAALVLPACGDEGGETNGSATPGVPTASALPPTPSPSPSGGSDPTPAVGPGGGTVPFGGTFAWEDGLSVSLGEPAGFEPSTASAGGERHSHHLRLTVTVTNGTGRPFDLSGMLLVVPDGDQVFDSTQDLLGAPYEDLSPGERVVFDVAFGVDDPTRWTVEVSRDWLADDESAVFGH